jgi:hypothetical protein
MTTYFTFGQDHLHEVGGICFDKDTVVRIDGENARDKMFALFGRKWAMQYDNNNPPAMSYYPGGIIDATNL